MSSSISLFDGPWDDLDLQLLYHFQYPDTPLSPGTYEPLKHITSPGPASSASASASASASDDPTRYHAGLVSAGSDSGPNQTPSALDDTFESQNQNQCNDIPQLAPGFLVITMEDRKRRRKESNRESARRSRVRKQKQLEALTDELSRLEAENRERSNQLELLIRHFHPVVKENRRLRADSAILRRRLAEIGRLLMFRPLRTPPPAAK